MNKKDFNSFLNGFKEVKTPKKKEKIQTSFDLQFKIKSNLNTEKIGYKLDNKIKNKIKKF